MSATDPGEGTAFPHPDSPAAQEYFPTVDDWAALKKLREQNPNDDAPPMPVRRHFLLYLKAAPSAPIRIERTAMEGVPGWLFFGEKYAGSWVRRLAYPADSVDHVEEVGPTRLDLKHAMFNSLYSGPPAQTRLMAPNEVITPMPDGDPPAPERAREHGVDPIPPADDADPGPKHSARRTGNSRRNW